MALMFTTAELADLQATVLTTLRDVATVTRGGSAIVAGVPCTVAADTVQTRFPWMAPGQIASRWILVLPVGTDVRPSDHITVAGDGVYAVVDTGTPQTYALSTEAFCYQMYAADGVTPLLFVPNATISILRGVYDAQTKRTSTATAVATGVRCYINDMGTELKLQGLAPAVELVLVCDSTVDLRDGDRISGYVGATTQRSIIYTVQHVDANDDSGMTFKVATLKAEG
jgi:hypothetical protein